jgi:tRNA(adenine34) deaminase
MDYEYFMNKALEQAGAALRQNEFPVGCVLVHENQVIVNGSRQGTSRFNETDHAEMVALRRLDALNPDIPKTGITLFCTLEPCLMCYAAILLSGLGEIVYAYEDVMGGGTSCDLAALPPLYASRRIPIVPNILRDQSLALFKSFFSNPGNRYWQGSLLARYTLEH